MSGRFGVIGQERKGVFKPIFLPVKAVNAVLRLLRLEKHPDKTFIGKIERGFDFLGYHFSRDGPRVAKATIQRFVERATRLYEQECEEPDGSSTLGMYDGS